FGPIVVGPTGFFTQLEGAGPQIRRAEQFVGGGENIYLAGILQLEAKTAGIEVPVADGGPNADFPDPIELTPEEGLTDFGLRFINMVGEIGEKAESGTAHVQEGGPPVGHLSTKRFAEIGFAAA